ncbi:MAG: YggT family protein [Spirochaetaceae bacterium]|jgi:YggT family protein|nr:YggT family protein [Spirochaetaceae bacterium]
MLQTIMSVVSGVLNVFSLLLFIRIILSWFSGNGGFGRPFGILCAITDPYLNYFRGFSALRVGGIDFSPVAALAVLSIISNVVSTIARFGRISLGIVLALSLGIFWSAVSFITGFLIFILMLRLVAYILKADIYAPFWKVIDTIASPIQFRINRLLFRGRIVNYLAALIVPIVLLAFVGIALGALTRLLERFFMSLPF